MEKASALDPAPSGESAGTVDHFRLFGEPRRPHLDPGKLKAKYLEFSARFHPDKWQGLGPEASGAAHARYRDLNTAYHVLREPRERLLHLLELERGHKPRDIQRIPPGTMDLFTRIGQACREVDAFLLEKAKATSPLLQVKHMAAGLEWTDRLIQLQGQVAERRAAAENELLQLNTAWEKAPADRGEPLPLDRLEELYRTFSYVTRWSHQIEERLTRLAIG